MLSEQSIPIHSSSDDIDRSQILSHKYKYYSEFLKFRYELRRDRGFSDKKNTKYLMKTHLVYDFSITFYREILITKKTILKFIRVYDDDLFFHEVRF